MRLREAEEKEQRERQRREEERLRREREEKERREKEKEEKARKEAQEREQRERERERERREKERREIERREMERERMLQQQRLSESSKMAAANAAQRDRSPLRNGNDVDATRIKEEPKREEELMMRGGVDQRYHAQVQAHAQAQAQAQAAHAQAQAAHAAAAQHYMVGRHMLPAPSHLSRAILTHPMGGPPLSHFGAPPASWPPAPGLDPYRDPYLHLRYPPGMMEAYRADEERAKAMYAAQTAAHLNRDPNGTRHLTPNWDSAAKKEPSPIPAPQHRMNPIGSMKPSPSENSAR